MNGENTINSCQKKKQLENQKMVHMNSHHLKMCGLGSKCLNIDNFCHLYSISLLHPVGSSLNVDCFWTFHSILTGFTMVVHAKIYLEAQMNNQYICLKNNYIL